MTPAQWARVTEVFADALEIPAAEQSAFVRATAADDEAVADEVLAMLSADARLGSDLVNASLDGLIEPPADNRANEASEADIVAGPTRPFEFPVGSEIDRFEVRGHIGTGAQAEVYLVADQKPFERDVVLKLFRLDWNAGLSTRVEREAAALSALTHQNIVRVLKFGHMESRPYIVMERIPGRTMHEVLATEGASTHRKLRWLEQLCDGLAAVHARQIVHRDLKPSNLMVDGDALTIFDFGIVRTQNSELTHLQQFTVGTPRYMSPEQISERHLPPGGLDGRSDLFTVGVIAWELWAARPAFTGEDLRGVMASILFGEALPPLTSILEGLDQELSEIIQRAVSRDYTARFQTAAELGAAFVRVRTRLSPNAPEPTGRASRLDEAGIETYTPEVPAGWALSESAEQPAVAVRRRWPIAAVATGALVAVVVATTWRSAHGPLRPPPPPPASATNAASSRGGEPGATHPGEAVEQVHDTSGKGTTKAAETTNTASQVERLLAVALSAIEKDGQLDQAEQAYAAALALAPGNEKGRAGLEQVRKMKKESIRTQVQARTAAAQTAIDDGRLEDAKREVEAAQRLDANDEKASALAMTLEKLEGLAHQR